MEALDPAQVRVVMDMVNTNPDNMIADVEHGGIKIKELSPIPAGSNPYRHDLYNMGCGINKDMHAMFSSCGNYIILIFTKTGRRIHFSFSPEIIGTKD